MTAADRWRSALEARAIPQAILDRAPVTPYGFSVDLFSRAADEALADAPDRSARRAAEALPERGELLDVGCGAGAGSLPIASGAGRLIGVDENDRLLAAFSARRADRLGVDHEEVLGRWPDIAATVGPADVVVCRHVAYNVPDLDPFLRRLTDHARVSVVLHLPLEHPLAWMGPYWRDIHRYAMPPGPTIDDALAVASEVGLDVEVEQWAEPFDRATGDRASQLDFLRRRLCVGVDREPELLALLDELGLPGERAVATVWWEGVARPPR